MYRFLCLITGLSLFASTAAQAHCASPTEEAVFELQGLKSTLTVLTLSCQLDERYNAFVHRFISTLGQDEKDFTAYFHRNYGGAAQREQDAWVTLLANAHAQEAINEGSDFCPRNTVMFDEIQALRGPDDLVPYAEGKHPLPATADACPEPQRGSPASHTTTRSSKSRSKS